MTINTIEHNEKHIYKVGLSSDGETKFFTSPGANYSFNLKTGTMYSWGRTFQDDPGRFPAPNILDAEITSICNHGCQFCYKSNNSNGKNMSFDTFKRIFDVLPKSITQIAFGADYDLSSNPDLWEMMAYAKEHGVIPNVTAGYVSEETADRLAEYCGAVAISRYESKDRCYDSIKRLTDRGMTQVNMHYMISEETYGRCLETLEDIKSDPRLAKLNAVVLLSLKKKGRGIGFHTLGQEKFDNICRIARESHIGIGFDSCSSLKAYRAFKDEPEVRDSIIPCEAARESSYINVDGEYFPCSFTEGCSGWEKGIDVLSCSSPEEFIDKVWFSERTLAFSTALEDTRCDNCEHCRHCPIYDV